MVKSIFFIFLLITVKSGAQDIIKKMYDANAPGHRKSLSFIQQTEFYRNDSLIRKATWYEVLKYPDKLRIDIGSPTSGSSLFFVNDSLYSFQKGELKSKIYQPHDLLFVLGGMYSYPLDSVYKILNRIGYNTSASFETTWLNRPVIVTGADNTYSLTNQIWIDKENLVVTRILNYKDDIKKDIRCTHYTQLDNKWCETRLEMYINDKLRQVEIYNDIKENIEVDTDFFNPYKLGQIHFWQE